MIHKKRYKNTFLYLFFVVLTILSFRWIVFEPYIIPSGSMIPSLLVNDYILVSKFTYGVRIPFSNRWIYGPISPKRGDVVVFKKPKEDYFVVKRVIGVGGDKISLNADGSIKINNKFLERKIVKSKNLKNFVFENKIGNSKFQTLFMKKDNRMTKSFLVPQKNIFVMGDNRDNSLDSRFWGSLPINYILGKASMIWMSCKNLEKSRLCKPKGMRWNRIGQTID